MNQFDDLYFSKYVREEDELLFVCHRHPILIIDNILLWCFFGVVLPVFFYLQNSFGMANVLWLGYFELYLFIVYVCLTYVVFDWYNDVWLITNRWIIDVDWKYFSGDIHYIEYESVHGIEVKTHSIIDSIFGKGDIYVHLESENEEFFLEDAVNPQGIVEYIQAVISEIHAHKHDPIDDRQPFELLLDTLTQMVREHLEKWWNTPDPTSEQERIQIEKALRYTSTVDLRRIGE